MVRTPGRRRLQINIRQAQKMRNWNNPLSFYFGTSISFLKYAVSRRDRLMDFLTSAVFSTLAVTMFCVTSYNLSGFNYPLLCTVLVTVSINLGLLGIAYFNFSRQSFNKAHAFTLKKRDFRAFPLVWFRAHALQLSAIPLALLLPPENSVWLLGVFVLSHAGVFLLMNRTISQITKVARETGKTLRVPGQRDFDREVEADVHFRLGFEVDDGTRIFKKRIDGELRNSILCAGEETVVRLRQPVQSRHLELALASATLVSHGFVTVYFDEQVILKKPVSMLHKGWNEFREFEAEPTSDVSNIKICLHGISQIHFSYRRVAPVQEQRNFLIIIVDGLRKDRVGLYQPGQASFSPATDRFFKDFTRFERAYIQGEWTLPAFASIATSLYSSHHRVIDPNYDKTKQLPADVTTLSEVLQKNGYYTFAIMAAPRVSHILGHQRGYDRFIFLDDRNIQTLTHKTLEVLNSHERENKFLILHYMDLRNPLRLNSPFCWDGTAMMTESDLDILKNAGNGVRSDQEPYFSRMYSNKMQEVDGLLDILFAKIERSYLRENTTVILTSDHGINLPTDKIDAWSEKLFSEERLSVPLLMRCPWRQETHGKVYDGFVESWIDLYPTVVELAGIEAKVSPYSRSFLPDKKSRFDGKEFVITEKIFKDDYECRILNSDYSYSRKFSLKNGSHSESICSTTSNERLDLEDEKSGKQIKKFRNLTKELALMQPEDHASELYNVENLK